MCSKFIKVVLLLCVLVAIFGAALKEVGAHKIQADRILVEEQNDTQSALTIRTQRVDPLDDLKKYRGGYNITNKHYWSSTIFTGKFGYIIAALWIASGLVYALISLVATLCSNKKKRINNRRFLWPVIFGILLTILAVVASGVALGGSSKFHSRAKTIKNIIVDAANNASGTIYNVTESVKAMQSDPQVFSSLDGSSTINSTLRRLNGEADNIQRKALKNMRRLNKGLNIMNVVTIVTVSLNLIFILALLASGHFQRFHHIFHMLIFLCWVLTFVFWLYFGLYYFLNKFAGDTCAALEEYRHDPRNSTLSSILPCNDQASAKTSLHEVGYGIHDIIDQINANIASIQSSSLHGVRYVCNPFSGPPDYNYQPQNCSTNTIQIGNIPTVLKMYACSNDTCKQGEFISASDYNTAIIYSSSVQNILDVYPGMESLVDCHLVKDAFSKILFNECKPLKKNVHMTWAAFATLSTIMVILLIIWAVKARRDSRYSSPDGSVKPNSISTENSEVETLEMGTKHFETRVEP